MLICHRRYRIVTDRAAIVAAIVLLAAQWFAPAPFSSEPEAAPMTTASIEAVPMQPGDQASGLSFSDLMLDLGLLLFLNR
ncbi:MAG: hypothetical protein KKC01_12815 [Gammaproteobacteria bacterium]|nr:hypothetical protein [Gammaproteobacteria bacterium]